MIRLLATAGRLLLTLLFVSAAILALLALWYRYEDEPWTRDGKLRADSAQVSPDVSGLVTEILVHDNQFVRVGTVLFVVDKERYAAKLDQADAAVAQARATLANAERERQRYLSLGDYTSREDKESRSTAVEVGQAALRQAQAERRVAQIDFDRSDVRARFDGYVTGFTMRLGDYVASGTAKFALVDTSSYYVLGYFEENKLRRFRPGDRARVVLLGDDEPLWGHVESLATGIADREDSGSAALLPNVTPTFSWIRLAQRVPVRIAIDQVPPDARMVAGRTATVTIVAPPGAEPPGGSWRDRIFKDLHRFARDVTGEFYR